jgi:hypothetical protein
LEKTPSPKNIFSELEKTPSPKNIFSEKITEKQRVLRKAAEDHSCLTAGSAVPPHEEKPRQPKKIDPAQHDHLRGPILSNPDHQNYNHLYARKRALEMTEASKAGLLKARLQSRAWRLQNLYLIEDEKKRVILIRMRPEQREFIESMHERNFIPKARKLGMSTILVILALDMCLFPDPNIMRLANDLDVETNENGGEFQKLSMRCGIIDMKETDAWEKLAMARLAWEKGPTDHPNKEIRKLWEKLHERNPLVTDTKGEMKWQNGSVFQAGVRYTGKTPQWLHVSELGPIAAQKPKTAEDIVRGSMNAVPSGGYVHVETTMEGGRIGECYDLFKLAMKSQGSNDLTVMDWKLHFFSWLRHPSYRLPGKEPQDQVTKDYFAKLTKEYGAEFESKYSFAGGIVPLERQAWYEKKKREQKGNMYQQFPTVAAELDNANVTGQIYPEITRLRAAGRVKAFEAEPNVPLIIHGDLGSGQNSAFWLTQVTHNQYSFLDCEFGYGKGAVGLAKLWRKWKQDFPNCEIAQILLPHDANTHDKGSGVTYVENLVNCGVPRNVITVVPMTGKLWNGIELVQNLLPLSWFHTRTDTEIEEDNGLATIKKPSGLGRLENYRRSPDTRSGLDRSGTPLGDICSHAADGVRTLAEALANHLVQYKRQLNRGLDPKVLGPDWDEHPHFEKTTRSNGIRRRRSTASFTTYS